ncbi:MerR family transcriptional regulator [Cohnella sp. CIP 111063]|jgi:Predicted transcriptional regulators|uniref:MerR family transcriptional regulator n=1 Tax=unclassified Cohnella TaxID=2636738 RepID=UPI000B8BEF71|nr:MULTISPECIES: MerR family transcriptional regulator [unclassified Cohnella]OXS62730.1 MerR family transcriptional regulator [Cohnella sp. CIP 111063]PRX75003.1 DNA-binding transcriptional MerR regulator [Cohnella sp. SGD-V74]
MNYTINEAARQFGLTAHTLRYYDKEGLLPFIGRGKSGNRTFSEQDLQWLALICCLKDTGMPIKEIKTYSDLCVEGGATAETRKTILQSHRAEVARQIDELQKNLGLIDAKIASYDDPERLKMMEEHARMSKERTE